MLKKVNIKGFTIVELAVVMVVLGILAALTYAIVVPRYRERTYYTRGISELNSMGNATKLYVAKHNEYPADVTRDVPAGIKEFVQGQEGIEEWPDAPWPGSVYDYDNWPPDGNGPEHTYQISVRMCDVGDSVTCKANANKYLKDYVSQSTLDSWDSYSAVYYCIKGSCRSHQVKPMNHPGYCVNCGGQSKVF